MINLGSANPVSRLMPEFNREAQYGETLGSFSKCICDAATTIFLERKRPDALQSTEWIARQQKKVMLGLEVAARDLGGKK